MGDTNRYLAALLSKGLSQQDLAATSGVDARTIRKLEQGQGVSLRTLWLVCKALGIEPEAEDRTEAPVEDDTRKEAGEFETPVARIGEAQPQLKRSRITAERLVNRAFVYGIIAFGVSAMAAICIGTIMVFGDALDVVRSEIAAEVSFPSADARFLKLATAKTRFSEDATYTLGVGPRLTRSDQAGMETVKVVLRPQWCPSGAPCSLAMRDAVFAEFSGWAKLNADAVAVRIPEAY